MNGDEYVALSPSTHMVPCSPFLRTYEASPAPCVPDVDRNATRRLYTTTQDSQGGTISPMRFSQPYSQSSQNDAQQIPATPCIDQKQKSVQKKISLEQVVPSCSPFINFDDEKPSNSQQASQESTTNDYLDISITNNNIEQKENSVPTDEKPPIMNHCRPLQDLEGPKPAKRQVRMMTKSTEIKPIDFLKSDNIFG